MILKRLTAKLNNFTLDKKIFTNIILMIIFWAIFDSIFSYLIPIFFSNLNLNKTQVGLIISSSSLFGAIFDFLLSKIFKNTHYRRLFLFFYIFCFLFPVILWSSSKFLILSILAMAIWGVYYDLMNFSIFDFIGNHTKSQNSQRFGLFGIFKSVGISIGPILAAFFINKIITFTPFLIAYIFLFISFLFYLVLIKLSSKDLIINSNRYYHHSFRKEFSNWKKIGFIIFPVMLFNTMLYIFDATFWVIGPMFSQSFENLKDFGGLFMLAYTLPSLIVCWFVGRISHKFGKKRTAFIAFLSGNILLLLLFVIKNPFLILVTVFCSSIISSVAWPSIAGAYGDYIYESDKYDREIEGLSDLSTNFGYIIGPTLAGLIADSFGVSSTFSILAIFNIIFTIFLLIFTPKNIEIPTKK